MKTKETIKKEALKEFNKLCSMCLEDGGLLDVRSPYAEDNELDEDAISKFISTLIDQVVEEMGKELKIESKSVDDLQYYMDTSYNEFSVKVAFKEGFNSALKLISRSINLFKGE